MTNPTRKSVLIVLAATVALGVAGCEKKKKAPPPPPPPPPPKVELPKPVDIQAVLQEMKSDARVKFVEEQAPADRSLAEGAIKLANALAKGDATGLKGMLDSGSRAIVDELQSSGDWESETKVIEQVRIVAVSNTSDASPTNSLVGMAIQAPGGAYLLAWNGTKQDEHWVFSAALSQPDKRSRASDFDGVSIQTTALPAEDITIPRPGANVPGAKPESGAAPAESPSNPRRKSTPAGPITIPGG